MPASEVAFAVTLLFLDDGIIKSRRNRTRGLGVKDYSVVMLYVLRITVLKNLLP